jgi:hypothetical protein
MPSFVCQQYTPPLWYVLTTRVCARTSSTRSSTDAKCSWYIIVTVAGWIQTACPFSDISTSVHLVADVCADSLKPRILVHRIAWARAHYKRVPSLFQSTASPPHYKFISSNNFPHVSLCSASSKWVFATRTDEISRELCRTYSSTGCTLIMYKHSLYVFYSKLSFWKPSSRN